jgi:hypothetical protein
MIQGSPRAGSITTTTSTKRRPRQTNIYDSQKQLHKLFRDHNRVQRVSSWFQRGGRTEKAARGSNVRKSARSLILSKRSRILMKRTSRKTSSIRSTS